MENSKNIGLKEFTISDKFWGRYQELVRQVVIPYQYDILEDKIPGVEKSHAVENFRIAAGDIEGEFYGMVFQDSDLAKWIEAAAYSLAVHTDSALEKTVDDLIDIMGRAACDDGYLNTYFTVKEPDHKWQNLQECHELYCAGHLIEAAVAYYEATGKDKLLNIMKKMADLICNTFGEGDGKQRGIPGHEEIELALMRLYHLTKDDKYKEMAKYFIDERGKEPNFFKEERKERGWHHFNMDPEDREYSQNHKPVREQKEAVGHAVRVGYLATGMADVAGSTDDNELMKACDVLFDNIAQKQMYITGGIGSTCHGEAFTVDYDLPNDTIYAETCAAISLVFFADKMLAYNKDSKYADVMERALYNNVLAGMQLDGKKFFYVNPLEVNPELSGKIGNYRHVLPERPGWFGCACCPPNVARLLASLGKYTYHTKGNTVYSTLFISGEASFDELGGLKITAETKYPVEGIVKYTFANVPKGEMTFAVRIPEFSNNKYKVTVNSKEDYKISVDRGYYYITGVFEENMTVTLELDMEPKKVYANTAVRYDAGCVAITRGPIVYCFEGVDNDGLLQELRINRDGAIKEMPYDSKLLDGIVPIEVEGCKMQGSKQLYSYTRPDSIQCILKAVPYYTWGNRGINQMRVWMMEN